MIALALAYLPSWWRILKWGLFTLILGFVGYKLGHLGNFFLEQKYYFNVQLGTQVGLFWWTALGLCGLNWLFEALKWKEVTRHWANMSTSDAIKSVVIGQALNLIVPASLGHFAGRLATLKNTRPDNGWLGTSAVLVCQIMQMLVTFFGFCLGWIYWKKESNMLQFKWSFVLGGLGLVFFAYMFTSQLRFAWWKKIQKGWSELSTAALFKIGVYSILRYGVFTTQFVLILYFLGVKNQWLELAAAISLVFMAKSVMPSIHFLSDLGIREFCALLVLPLIGLPEKLVIAASLWVWMINILLPSLLGACWVLRVKTMSWWKE